MKRSLPNALRGVEQTSNELRAIKVKGVNGVVRTEMLPADPVKAAAILAERRTKPAGKARAKLVAEAKRRGL
jgi:hypothetical protein